MGLVESRRNDIMDKIFQGTDFDVFTPIRVSLHTDDPGSTGANEVSGGSYSRQEPANGWTLAVGGDVFNDGPVEFVDMPAVTVSHIGLWEDDGSFLWGGTLTTSRDVAAGQTVKWQDSDLIIPTKGR